MNLENDRQSKVLELKDNSLKYKFLDALERYLLSRYHLSSLHYQRYIDDIFFMWTQVRNIPHDLAQLFTLQHNSQFTLLLWQEGQRKTLSTYRA